MPGLDPRTDGPVGARRRRTPVVFRAALPHTLLLALLCAFLVAVPTAAQEAAQGDDRELFVDTVDVDVVNLQVSVTDKDGKPIRGLSKEDFVVEEDGDRVELTNFYAVESSMRRLDEGEAEAGGSGAGDLVALPEQDQAMHLAVIIDNSNIAPSNRKRALDQLRDEMVRVVRPGDRVMIGVLDPLPRVIQPFTDDLASVDAALDRVGRFTAGARILAIQEQQIYAEIAKGNQAFGPPPSSGPGPTPDSIAQPIDYAALVLGRMESYANQATAEMERTFAGLRALIASMGGLPGRKAVLYASDGLSTNPAIHLYETFLLTYPQEGPQLGVRSATSETSLYDLSEELQRLIRDASASRVTFYTLDTMGTRSAVAGVEFSAPTAIGAGADLTGQDSLVQLAAATGGETMLNNANVAALLETVSQDHSDYYSLGYVSDKSRDSEFHRIKVRLPGVDGAKVRHTEGYRAKTIEEEMSDRTLSALVLDVARNPLEVRIELGKEQAENRNRWVLPVLVKVPISNLVLVPQEKMHRGKITIFVAVSDDDGGLSEPQHFVVPVDIPNEQLLAAMSREVGYGVNLMVRGGPGKLAVGVRDDIAAVESTVNLQIAVGES